MLNSMLYFRDGLWYRLSTPISGTCVSGIKSVARQSVYIP